MAKRKTSGDDFSSLHANHRGRMRARVLRQGAASLEQHELLELLLYLPIARQNTNRIAHRLVDRFGSAEEALFRSVDELMQVDGIGEQSAQFLRDVGRVVEAYAEAKRNGRPVLDNSVLARRLALEFFEENPQAEGVMFPLDEAMRILAATPLEREPSTQTLISATARACAAGTVIALRDAGGGKPSHSEKKTFEMLNRVLSLLNVAFVDFLIVGEGGSRSYLESARKTACALYDESARLNDFSLHFTGGRDAVRFEDVVSGRLREVIGEDAAADGDGFDGEAVAAFAAAGGIAASDAVNNDTDDAVGEDAPYPADADDGFSDAEIDPEEIYETVVEPLGTVGQLGGMEEAAPPEADAFADLLGDADEEPF